MKKKIKIMKKKITAELVGLMPNCFVNFFFFFFLYCKVEIVLQEEVGLAGSCIAIQQIVLQGCVVGWEEKLYCKTGYCIVTEAARGIEDCIAIQSSVL